MAGRKTTRHGGGHVPDPQAVFQRAVSEYEAGRFRKARKTLSPLLEHPDPQGYVTLLCGLIDAALAEWKSAEKRLAAAVKILPRRMEAWMGLGNARFALGDPQNAAEAFQYALQLQRDNASAWYNLGIAHAGSRRDHDAIAAYERAIDLEPSHDVAKRARANALARVARFDQADEAFRELLSRCPDDPELSLEHAELLEKANRTNEAIATLPRLSTLRQPRLIAWREVMYARLIGREGKTEEAIQTVQRAWRKTREDWLGFAEGNLLDEQGDVEGALRAFRRANESRMRLPAYRRLRDQDALGYIEHKLTQGVEPCAACDDPVEQRSPMFIIGLPRSGTTLLDRILAAHPGIQVLEEPQSLRVAEAVIAEGGSIADARERYWSYLERTIGVEPSRLVVDKNPMHVLHLDQLSKLFPRASVVLSLRHPYDSALSCFMQDFALHPVTVHFLDLQATAAMCRRLLNMMRLYEEACPENTYRIRYENLVEGDYRPYIEGLLESAGLKWHKDIEHFTEKARDSGIIKSASYAQVTRGLYSSAVERWRRYEPWIGEEFRAELGPELGYWGYEAQ